MPMTIKPGKLSNVPAQGYTPASDVDPYVVVLQGNHPYMTNVAIPANVRGSLVPSGGSYQIGTTPTASATAPEPGDDVYYSEEGDPLLTHLPADTGEGTYYHFGRVSPGTAITTHGAGSYSFEVEHDPNGEVVVEAA
jgi:hypothetical protein